MYNATLVMLARTAPVLALLSGACKNTIPDVRPVPIDLPAPDPGISVATVPISFSLAAVRDLADRTLPASMGAARYNESINGGADNCGSGASLGWSVARSPLTISASGSRLLTAFGVDYWADGRARSPVCGPLVYGSCGVGEPLRNASISFETAIAVTDQWDLAPTTTANGAVAGNRCKITLLNFDVTEHVLGRFNAAMSAAAPQMDRQLASSADLRRNVTAAWTALQDPIQIAPATWLAIRPVGLGLSQLDGNPDRLQVRLQLRARPEIAYGNQPTAAPSPLPGNEAPVMGDAFIITIPVSASYDILSTQARRLLKLEAGGIRYPATGKFFLRPDDVEVYGYGRTAVVRLRVKGSAKGVIYLVGTPTWDAGRSVLSFPDLAYTLETKNLLLKLVNWAEGDALLADLRQRLTFDLREQLSNAQATANTALNRKFDHVTLTGSVISMSVLGLYSNPAKASFQVLATASGTLAATINP